MGVDKALLPIGSGTLLEKAAEAVRTAVRNVTVIGDPVRYGHLVADCRPDVMPGFGPLSGIHAALAGSSRDWNLICACDMPDLDAVFLRILVNTAFERQSLCVAAGDPDGSLHPLCAAYHRDCLPFVERAIELRRLSVMRLLEEVGTTPVLSPHPLANCNTPEEWAAVPH